MGNDIRYESWYWPGLQKDDHEAAQRSRKGRQRRRNARWMKWARRVLLAELAVILFEGMFQFGDLVRGYPSIGGEGIALLALIGFSAWKLRELIK